MVFPDIGNVKYPHGRTDIQTVKIALHFTERPLTTVVTLCMLSLEAARLSEIVLFRETRISPPTHVIYRALLRSACYTAMSRCFQAPSKGTHLLICKLHMEIK